MGSTILVLGATGLVGSSIFDTLRSKVSGDVIGTGYSQTEEDCVFMDMKNPFSIRSVIQQIKPHTIYVTSYISNVDQCEKDGSCRSVNVDGLSVILEASLRVGAKVIFISSSYVFDGRKKSPYTIWDTPSPIQQYGIQKLLGENLTFKSSPDNVVVRTVGVFGYEKRRKNFACQIVDLARAKKQISASVVQTLNPIHADSLAGSVVSMVELGYCGILHVAGDESVSKFQFARDILQANGITDYDIIVAKETKFIAQRPTNACLYNNVQPKGSYFSGIDRFLAQEEFLSQEGGGRSG